MTGGQRRRFDLLMEGWLASQPISHVEVLFYVQYLPCISTSVRYDTPRITLQKLHNVRKAEVENRTRPRKGQQGGWLTSLLSDIRLTEASCSTSVGDSITLRIDLLRDQRAASPGRGWAKSRSTSQLRLSKRSLAEFIFSQDHNTEYSLPFGLFSVAKNRLDHVAHSQLPEVSISLPGWSDTSMIRKKKRHTCPQPTKMMGCPVTYVIDSAAPTCSY